MKQVSYGDLSVRYGYPREYFSVVKIQNPEKFKKMFSFHKNRAMSIVSYINWVQKIHSQMEKVLFSYKNFSSYGRLLQEHGLTGIEKHGLVYPSDSRTVFRARDTDSSYIAMQLDTVNRWEKIVELHKEIFDE